MLGLAMLLAAAILLAVGAETFVEHAAAAGRRLGTGTLAVGLLLAGAEPEELVTAVLAALRGQPGVAVGDAVGANVTLTTLVLGALALISAVPLRARVRRYAWFAALAAGLAAAAIVSGAAVSRPEGVGLVAVYGVVVAVLWRHERAAPAFGERAELHDDGERPDVGERRGLVLALLGVAIMGAGGFLAVTGAARVTAAFGLDDTAVGLTVVALATTGEFVALLVASARRGIPELAVAGVFGSVLYNATVTLGAAAVVAALPTDRLAAVAAVTAAVLPAVVLGLGGRRRVLTRRAGVILLAMYVVYVVAVADPLLAVRSARAG